MTTELDEAVKAAVEEATQGLVKKNQELIAELREAKKGRQIDPSEIEKLESKIEQLTNDLTVAQKASKTVAGDAEKFKKQLEAEAAFTQKLLVDNGLTSELVKANVAPHFLPAVKAMLASQVAVMADGDSRKAMIGDKELSAFVAEWANGDDGKHYVLQQQNTGGGARGSAGASDGAKTISRAQFDALDPSGRLAHAKAGGQVID